MRTIEEIMAAQTAIIDAAAGRTLTDEESAQFEALEAEIRNVERDQQIRARHAAYNTSVVPAGQPTPGGPRSDGTYNQAFNHYARTGKVNADLETLSNAQSEGVPSEGGYLVPDEFRQKLVKKFKAFGGLGRRAERYTTGNGRPVDWPVEGDDTANEGEIVQEGNTFSTGADLTFDTNALGSYSYVAGGAGGTPLRLSWELAQDAAFDLEGMIANKLGKRIARMQARHWVRGTGAGEPLGLVTGRTPVQTLANNALTYDDFVNWIHSLDPAYRGAPGMEEDSGASPEWWFNDAFLKQAKLMKDSHGDPIYRGWGANMALGFNNETLMGYPVNVDQQFVDFDNDDSTDLFGAFGDVGQGYVIRDVKAATLLVNPYSRQSYRQNEYTLWARADGTQQDTNAYIVLSGKS